MHRLKNQHTINPLKPRIMTLPLLKNMMISHEDNLPLSQKSSIEYSEGDILIERMPDIIHSEIIDIFEREYHFINGEQMRVNNYFVKISESFSNTFLSFIHGVIEGLSNNQFPSISPPHGFKPINQNLLQSEQDGGFSFGSFDMAVTNEGLQNIEFQSVATYPISAAKMNQCLLSHMSLDNAYIFADSPKTNWNKFIKIYNTIIGGNQKEEVTLIDRKIEEQKTNFEFFATQKELDIPIEIVDIKDLFEKDNELYYKNRNNRLPQKISRLYNRVLLAEALFEDNYPDNNIMWKFRFDKSYNSLTFINHPIKQFEVSKRLSPYISNPFNPECHELSKVAQEFKNNNLEYNDFVWKHKWGAAGHRLILSPNEQILEELSPCWDEYIAQKKVIYKTFKTEDDQEKIVELRFMTAIHENEMIVVPMARLGQVITTKEGNTQFRIHFGDNNAEGYGFSPVIIMGSNASSP